MNGYGVRIYATGNTYEGQWANDLKHGKGKFTWKEGNKYNGDYFKDKMHG
jgi:hypothetical protein